MTISRSTSIYRTRAEWEDEQGGWDEHSRRFEAEWSERERLGMADPMARADGSPTIWSRSISVEGAADVPLGMRVFGIGCHLAELIVRLCAGNALESTPLVTQQHLGNWT